MHSLPPMPYASDPQGEFPLSPADFAMHLASAMAVMRDGALDQALRPLGLSTSRYRVLGVLVRFGSLRMTDVANLTATDRTSLTRIADQMINAGQVSRASSAKDRRQVFLEITEAGREAHRDAVAIVLGYNGRLLDGIPEEVQRDAARTLITMAGNLAPNPAARDGIVHYADPANDAE